MSLLEGKKSWFGRLSQGLAKSSQKIAQAFGAGVDLDEAYDLLEAALLQADCGIAATQALLKNLKAHAKADNVKDAAALKICLEKVLAAHLAPLQTPLNWAAHKPYIALIAGVNGAGKTTSIGKLANWFAAQGASVLLAAGDTFRAAAREQLNIWAQRNDIQMLSQQSADPASIAFDSIAAAKARGAGVLLIDTAGRLPTQGNLMAELAKIHRVCAKAGSEGEALPHGVWLVLDGNTGQNAVAQLQAFKQALPISGLIITKLDGTAKGGVLAAIAQVCPTPVLFVGVGEGIDDLQPFDAAQFAQALLS